MISRRSLLKQLGVSSAVLPFLGNLPSFAAAATTPRKRLVIVFSPDGVVKKNFWPTEPGPFGDTPLPAILEPFTPFRDQLLTLEGVHNRIAGDGDGHMRGIGCLLTGIELFPGNIQGGSDTPAGWASGLSIDQELKNFFQSNQATATRFGSLEFGVLVPDRADTWTRMVYAGPNRPVTPIDDPYQMFDRLYGQTKDRESLQSVLDDVRADLATLAAKLPAEDRRLLEEHTELVRNFERELASHHEVTSHPVPVLEEGVVEQNDQMPTISRMQIDLLVNAMANDMTRIASLQFMRSVGQARMNWLNISDNHHTLSHKPDKDPDAVQKLTKINTWFAGELAYLVQRLSQTPEPGTDGTLLDNTLIVWCNELGKGNNHTLDNIPFTLIGGGLNFKTNRALDLKGTPHNRLLLTLAHSFGHHVETFGNPNLSQGGVIDLG